LAINMDKPNRWKDDVAASVDLYNEWFLRFAPDTFRGERRRATSVVLDAYSATQDLVGLEANDIRRNPAMLPVLRMATCPPIARDRLVGLARVTKSLVMSLEAGQLPPRMASGELNRQLAAISSTIRQLLDVDLLPWIPAARPATDEERARSASVVADRLCGALADPIIRNAQEQRQLDVIAQVLRRRSYSHVQPPSGQAIGDMKPGTFAFRLNVMAGQVRIPIDVVIQPRAASLPSLPLLIEAKSAGDFTNTNKRRKEEAQKFQQLRTALGRNIRYVLFLCGYFDTGYLGYEAAEGIDFVWEHRLSDMLELGI
jgi:XamI restriction endonuclease